MELLKVFVGDGTTTTKTIPALGQGDLLLVKASDNTVLTAASAIDPTVITNSTQVRVVSRNSKGLVYSTPFSKNDVIRVNYTAGAGVTQKKLTATLKEVAGDSTTVSNTYSLGIQIKEDLRMGTYNKNTEVIVSATTPSNVYNAGVYADAAEAAMMDITSTMAKGFAANPLTSAGSPYQLVNVTRLFTGTTAAIGAVGATFAVTQGARQVQVTGTLTAPSVGHIINVNGSHYLVEGYDSTNKIITLDTAYQGATGTGINANTLLQRLTAITAYTFVFEGVAQTRSNRFDQYRVTDFEVIYPKGFYAAGDITIATTTALVYGKGTWAQVRDMEERSFTNISPLVNYREFPFSDYELNSDLVAVGSRASTNYNLFTLVHNAPAGYNYMQSSGKTFPQVTVIAAPTSSQDGTVASNDHFGSVLTAWWSGDDTPTSADFV